MSNHTAGGGTTHITRAGIPQLDQRLDKIAAMYDYERTQQIEPWADLWADDARVTFPLDSEPGSRTVEGKEAIVPWTRNKFVERASTDIDARLEAVAGAPRVIAHLDVFLHFENGLGIGGPLVAIFTFDEDGKVVLMEEYVNDAYFPKHYKDLATPDAAQAVND
ncbi:nuclear transport factor 2 family protein [Sinomonas sp. G460-2]|uniref:nuclear transport factor 2 family protein n=1 Tax=Sinomonas sp. G460-2 TaxID=3393464 RepID=UPI0039F091A5